jgi:hypothetical protein
MPERPHPNMDRVRDALRDADERDDTAPPEPEAEEAKETAEDDDEDSSP